MPVVTNLEEYLDDIDGLVTVRKNGGWKRDRDRDLNPAEVGHL